MSEQRNAYLFAVLCLTVVVLVIGSVQWSNVRSVPKVNPDTYQALFLTNNQQYFGHLHGVGTKYPYLTDIYYVRSQPQTGENVPQQKFTLVKLGDEIHGPEDVVYLNWGNVLFWENLKNSSQVVLGIQQEKAQRAQAASQSQQLTPQDSQASSEAGQSTQSPQTRARSSKKGKAR